MSNVATTISPKLRLLDIKQVSEATQTAESVIYAKVAAGKFPKPFKIGRKNVWRESTLIAFMDRQDRKAGNHL